MNKLKTALVALGAAAVLGVAIAALGLRDDAPPDAAPPPPAASAKPALTVTTTQLRRESLPRVLVANGNIAAWQEASVGTEANGLRLSEVRANVGDRVERGAVLAVFADDTVQAALAQARASVAEADAALANATANARRARQLQTSGAMSAQEIQQHVTAERTAQARVEAARAAVDTQQLRLRQTVVRAPDDGVVSARSATLGAVLPAGQELFRLIRQGRLEWRAEVPASDLSRLQPGMPVQVAAADAQPVEGTVRMVAPTVDPHTRNGLVYVDLAPSTHARAGMFARGEFALGSAEGLTLPQTAVQLRDGFRYVLRVGDDARVVETKVEVGRRIGDRIEITAGLEPSARVVVSGGAFLADGDLVRVVDGPLARASETAGDRPAKATR